MSPRWWRFGALLVVASLAAASCSGSTPAAKVKHKHHARQALAAPTTTPPSTTPSTTSPATGNTGTGNTGAGNTGTGNTGTGNTGTGNSGSAPTTTEAPAVGGVTATSAPDYVITASGKLKIRHLGPAISRFKPTSSPAGGTVTIVGRRLAHATAVTFDGIQATISANGSTKIKAAVPPGATSGPITVVTAYGSATVYGFVVT